MPIIFSHQELEDIALGSFYSINPYLNFGLLNGLNQIIIESYALAHFN